MILFADDTNLFFPGSNIHDVCSILNDELTKLSRWYKLNKLYLNIKKTNCMILKQKIKILEIYRKYPSMEML